MTRKTDPADRSDNAVERGYQDHADQCRKDAAAAQPDEARTLLQNAELYGTIAAGLKARADEACARYGLPPVN